ncbi:unnamed protein product, partial [marine sediment metagenome]
MIIDHLNQTIQIKICYFGPALSGKTTTMKSLFNHFGKKDRMLSVESSLGRTLFFDYGIITFKNQQWLLKIHLYSTTGQDFYIVTRPITLQAIDVLTCEYASNKSNKISKKNLDQFDKFIRVGISRTNIDNIIAETIDSGKTWEYLKT